MSEVLGYQMLPALSMMRLSLFVGLIVIGCGYGRYEYDRDPGVELKKKRLLHKPISITRALFCIWTHLENRGASTSG